MSVHLGTLYHWTLKGHRRSILRNGLQVMEPCSDGCEAAFPWICLATTPSSAWSLLPTGTHGLDGGPYDLWQVQIDEGDQLQIRGDFAPHVREVRVLHGLPPDRLWWVGEREAPAHMTMEEP